MALETTDGTTRSGPVVGTIRALGLKARGPTTLLIFGVPAECLRQAPFTSASRYLTGEYPQRRAEEVK